MVQFNVNGQILDLYDDTQIVYQVKNNAFTPGAIELSRTVSFAIPATTNNKQIFDFACDKNRFGEFARIRIATQLQSDSVAIDGELYINDFKNDEFNCVFVFGEFVPFLSLSEADELKNIVSKSTSATCTDNASALNNRRIWQGVRYDNGNTNHLPSYCLSAILEQYMPQFGVSVDIPDDLKGYRAIIGKPQLPKDRTATITRTAESDRTRITNNSIITYSELYPNSYTLSGRNYTRDAFGYSVSHFKKITIKFPSNFPNNLFVLTQNSDKSYKFFGDYRFDVTQQRTPEIIGGRSVYGQPLGGRSIEISVDSDTALIFAILPQEQFKYYVNGDGIVEFQGFIPDTNGNIAYHTILDYDVKISVGDSLTYTSQQLFLADNIGNLKFFDLLHTLSIVGGRYLTANGNTLQFADFENWDVEELKDVVSESVVKRTVSDWSQDNAINWDRDEYVLPIFALNQHYQIDNQNINNSKELYKVGYSEGNGSTSVINAVAVQDLVTYTTEEETKIENQATKSTLCVAGTNAVLLRASTARVAMFDRVCRASTYIELSVKMTFAQFANLRQNVIFWHDGNNYVWISAKYSKNLCNFALQKI